MIYIDSLIMNLLTFVVAGLSLMADRRMCGGQYLLGLRLFCIQPTAAAGLSAVIKCFKSAIMWRNKFIPNIIYRVSKT